MQSRWLHLILNHVYLALVSFELIYTKLNFEDFKFFLKNGLYLKKFRLDATKKVYGILVSAVS
jgi:hypothetical protein